MKDKFTLIGVIALAAAIAIVLSGCKGNKFIYESPDFDSSQFTARAFDDVIAATAGEHNITGLYISELIFVRQSGTQLTFRNLDGSTSKTMQIQSATEGLSEGQRVRVYYYVNSNMTRTGDMFHGGEAWGVFAIERL